MSASSHVEYNPSTLFTELATITPLVITTDFFTKYSKMGMVEFVNIINQFLKIHNKIIKFSPELFPIVSEAFKSIKTTNWVDFFSPDDQQVIDYKNKIRKAQGLTPIDKVFGVDADCPICYLDMPRPITLDCGHVICCECSKKVDSCPSCRAPINPLKLDQSGLFIPARALTQVPEFGPSPKLAKILLPPPLSRTMSCAPDMPDSCSGRSISYAAPISCSGISYAYSAPRDDAPVYISPSFKPCEHIGVDNDDHAATATSATSAACATSEASAACAEPGIEIKCFVSGKNGIVEFAVPKQENTKGTTDYVFVVDRSGSMSKYFKAILEALKSFVDHMNPNDRISVIFFSAQAVQLFPLSRPSEELKAKICHTTICGSITNYKPAAELAKMTIEEAQTRNQTRQTCFAFLTDGASSDGSDGFSVIREIIQLPRTTAVISTFGGDVKYASIEEILNPINALESYTHYDTWIEFSVTMNKRAGGNPIAVSDINLTFINDTADTFTAKSRNLTFAQEHLKHVVLAFEPTGLSVTWVNSEGAQCCKQVAINAECLAATLNILVRKTEIKNLQVKLGKMMSDSENPRDDIEEFKRLSETIISKIILVPDMNERDFLMNLQKTFVENIKSFEDHPFQLPSLMRSQTTLTANRVISQLSQN